MLTFAGAALDRAPAARRDPEWVAARRAEQAAGCVLVSEGGARVDEQRLLVVPAGDTPGEMVFLGLLDGRPLFAAEADSGAPGRTLGLRELASLLPAVEAGLVAYASSLLSWHRRHRFCANCGAATAMADAGHERTCPSCEAHHFPRTDPVVIMRVTDGERLLLGHQPGWPAGRYSVLAGFVEPGETLEQSVRREVREEAALEVGEVSYVASQPWPFPSSLMLGFHAVAGGDPRPDGVELSDVRWFERGELLAAAEGGDGLLLPSSYSISRRLIDDWLGLSGLDGRGTPRRSW